MLPRRPRPTPRFRRPRLRSRRGTLLGWWSLWRVPALVTIVAAAWWFAVRPVAEERGWVAVDLAVSLCGAGERTPICVIDGDTLLVTTPGERPHRVRLTGFDAPELDGTCEAERALAIRARTALADWLGAGRFEWNGADAPPRDRYGRELRKVRRVAPDGEREDLAEAMIARGLASPAGWGSEAVDWCR
jgi:endonuclease YncB( thermonuclease family)